MDAEEMSALWAPWRAEYFLAKKIPDFFLKAARTKNDAAHLVVTRRSQTFLVMNRYPYTVGHLMAVPNRKVANSTDLTAQETLELWELAGHAQKLLRKAVKAQGFNIGLNLGKCAGAGVADHLHLHIVPRWNGDHNFMPTLGRKRLLSEAIESLYTRLLKIQKLLPSPSESRTPKAAGRRRPFITTRTKATGKLDNRGNRIATVLALSDKPTSAKPIAS